MLHWPSIALIVTLALLATPSELPSPPPAKAEMPKEAWPVVGTVEYVDQIDSARLQRMAKPRSLLGKLTEWIAGPAERPSFGRPYAVVEDSAGRLFAADPGQRVIHILDFERNKTSHLSSAQGEAFLAPIAIAVDPADNLYAVDSERACIYIFNRKGEFVRRLGDGKLGWRFRRPTGIALDSKRGRIFVSDTWQHQILVTDFSGSLLATIGQRGTNPGEFNFPTSLVFASGRLYAVDAMNFRVQVFSSTGEFITGFGQLGSRSGSLNRPKGIGVDSDGHIYVVDAMFETVQVFNADGKLLYYFGSTGTAPGQFVLPAGIHIDSRNRIYVADSHNQRIQVFRYRQVRQP